MSHARELIGDAPYCYMVRFMLFPAIASDPVMTEISVQFAHTGNDPIKSVCPNILELHRLPAAYLSSVMHASGSRCLE